MDDMDPSKPHQGTSEADRKFSEQLAMATTYLTETKYIDELKNILMERQEELKDRYKKITRYQNSEGNAELMSTANSTVPSEMISTKTKDVVNVEHEIGSCGLDMVCRPKEPDISQPLLKINNSMDCSVRTNYFEVRDKTMNYLQVDEAIIAENVTQKNIYGLAEEEVKNFIEKETVEAAEDVIQNIHHVKGELKSEMSSKHSALVEEFGQLRSVLNETTLQNVDAYELIQQKIDSLQNQLSYSIQSLYSSCKGFKTNEETHQLERLNKLIGMFLNGKRKLTNLTEKLQKGCQFEKAIISWQKEQEDKMQKLQSKVEGLKAEILRLQEREKHLSTIVQDKEAEIDNLTKQMEENRILKDKIQELEEKAVQRQAAVDQFTKENSIQKEELATISKTISCNPDGNNDKTLRKPFAKKCQQDCILLSLTLNENLEKDLKYQVMYEENYNGKWKLYSKEYYTEPNINIEGLNADSSYKFKVRLVDENTGLVGPFSDDSDVIKTRKSPLNDLLLQCDIVERGSPVVYRLKFSEVLPRNQKCKTRKLYLGENRNPTQTKNILLIGANGSGKDTLIDGMMNFIIGVKWKDPFRFTVNETRFCKNKKQVISHDDWITSYSIASEYADSLECSINLIDVPSFDQFYRNEKIIEYICQLITAEGNDKLSFLNAVCFVLKFPEEKRVSVGRNVFDVLLHILGKNMHRNIHALVTSADGRTLYPKSEMLHFDCKFFDDVNIFQFNNSALFADNTEGGNSYPLSSLFWEIAVKCYKTFFDCLATLQSKSLSLTLEVVQRGQTLERNLSNLEQVIQAIISKMDILARQINVLDIQMKEKDKNANYTYKVDEYFKTKVENDNGKYILNCLTCNYTCHDICTANNDKKAQCSVMDINGRCTICPMKCDWAQHMSVTFRLKLEIREKTKCYQEMKTKYEELEKKCSAKQQTISKIREDINTQEKRIDLILKEIIAHVNILQEICLRPEKLRILHGSVHAIASQRCRTKQSYSDILAAIQTYKQKGGPWQYVYFYSV